MAQFTRIQVFKGSHTGQTTALGQPAEPHAWYWQPGDYQGEILWSEPFDTLLAAAEAGREAMRLQQAWGERAGRRGGG